MNWQRLRADVGQGRETCKNMRLLCERGRLALAGLFILFCPAYQKRAGDAFLGW